MMFPGGMNASNPSTGIHPGELDRKISENQSNIAKKQEEMFNVDRLMKEIDAKIAALNEEEERNKQALSKAESIKEEQLVKEETLPKPTESTKNADPIVPKESPKVVETRPIEEIEPKEIDVTDDQFFDDFFDDDEE